MAIYLFMYLFSLDSFLVTGMIATYFFNKTLKNVLGNSQTEMPDFPRPSD